MTYITKIHSSNDFWMSIIDTSLDEEDFIKLDFPDISKIWLNDLDNQLKILVFDRIRDFEDLQSIIKSYIITEDFKFIKVHPEKDPAIVD